MWGDTGRALGDGQALAADELEAERMALFAERAKLRGLEG